MGLHFDCENLVRSISEVERIERWRYAMAAPENFVKALQHEPIPCATLTCRGYVDCTDMSQAHDRIKTFHLHCTVCGWEDHVHGLDEPGMPWSEAELQGIIEEHLLHLQPICPFDQAPVIFTSLPNPRRRARYRIACHYCGCSVEMDWPPQEAKW